ncbi:RDD family protein [Salinarchaeum sp. IM2453]|uniref:RDD family protein n=1 Tax=Salinarchaeum sp. IM2453 TaxID=2862870 RepID=UPI002104D50A
MAFVGLTVTLVYGFLLEELYGYTPGKYLLGLVVIKSDGSNCTIGASIVRNLLWIVDALPTFNLVAMVLILLTDDNQRVGDLVADTVVVRQQ